MCIKKTHKLKRPIKTARQKRTGDKRITNTCAFVLDGIWFPVCSGGQLSLERIVFRPFGLKCTPLEPALHNHVGPTDASKGRNCHGEPANLVEKEPPGDHFFTRTQGATFILEKIYHHWNQFHKTTSGQQILPRATAPMGNMMGPVANTNTTRLGTQA